jgi:PIN domain nuclease of toxin-antitoxin system
VRYLLDTHALVWWLYNPARLSTFANAAVSEPENEIFASAISAYELANKYRLGKWSEIAPLAAAFEEIVRAEGFGLLHVTGRHAALAGQLPGEPCDPFDRLIAAQARIERMQVLTINEALRALGAEIVW